MLIFVEIHDPGLYPNRGARVKGRVKSGIRPSFPSGAVLSGKILSCGILYMIRYPHPPKSSMQKTGISETFFQPASLLKMQSAPKLRALAIWMASDVLNP